jgi:copper type II ascorbate-dependent monooxygenase-like protein
MKHRTFPIVLASLSFTMSCVPSPGPESVIGGKEPNDRAPAPSMSGSPMQDPSSMMMPAPMPSPAPSPSNSPTWWADIEPIIHAECLLCHASTPLYGAPMPLATYANLMAPAWSDPSRRVHQLVVDRIRGVPGKSIMPPRANGALTAQQIDLIARWSAAGAPEGTPPDHQEDSDAGTAPAPDGGGVVDEPPDAGAPNPEEPYQMIDVVAAMAAISTGTTDLYGCFRTIVHLSSPVHAVEITPVIDKPSVVHHILLFRDRGRGYPDQRTGLLCALDTIGNPYLELLTGWAPGGTPFVMPPEAGIRIEDGDYLIVQIHYNNPMGAPVVDSSGMRFKTTTHLRANDAAVVGIGTTSFSLPPGQTSVSRSGTCSIQQTMHTFVFSPHMHLLGKAARLDLVRGGQTMPLADVPNFAFDSQIHYPGTWTFNPGDGVTGTCTWDTTSRSSTTPFGEGTSDEMCFLFVGHYPPIGKVSCTN